MRLSALSALAQLARSPAALFAALMLGTILTLAVFAPAFAPQDTYDPGGWELADHLRPPAWTDAAHARPIVSDHLRYVLGSDHLGRDLWSAILFGLRISLLVSFSVVLCSSLIGTVLGIIAGYVGGAIDALIMRMVDIWLSFPSILVALFILSIWREGGLERLIIAIVIVRWVAYARTARGCTLAEKERDYVAAARALGQRPLRIMFGHILPNVLSPLAIIAAVDMAMVIMLEATLSFLGVGTSITEPSLGMLIKDGADDLLSGAWWITVFPGLALVLVVFSINVLVDWLRDVLNPHLAATAGLVVRAE